MDRSTLEEQARGMSTAELHSALDWYRTLADHSDDNMDFSGYHSCQEKIEVIKDELSRRPRY